MNNGQSVTRENRRMKRMRRMKVGKGMEKDGQICEKQGYDVWDKQLQEVHHMLQQSATV